MRALVVEDEPVVREDVADALRAAGFRVDVASDGRDAWFRGGVDDYDVCVLDLGLPGMDGLSVLRRWRAEGRAFPVLVLSARGDWTDRIEGIETGADDYLGKPFAMEELVVRARALVRRAAGHATPLLACGRLVLDTRRLTATLDGRPVRLSALEFRLLDHLAHQAGRAVSATALAEQLYGSGEPADVNAIEALVLRLRRKHGADLIETRRGFDYLLAATQ